jgi:hypothetical protein
MKHQSLDLFLFPYIVGNRTMLWLLGGELCQIKGVQSSFELKLKNHANDSQRRVTEDPCKPPESRIPTLSYARIRPEAFCSPEFVLPNLSSRNSLTA